MRPVDCILVIQNPRSNIWAFQLIAEDVLKIGSLWGGLVQLGRGVWPGHVRILGNFGVNSTFGAMGSTTFPCKTQKRVIFLVPRRLSFFALAPTVTL